MPADQTLTTDDDLQVEGLAAQLMFSDFEGRAAWWHLTTEKYKQQYRARARAQIADFHRRNDIPDLPEPPK